MLMMIKRSNRGKLSGSLGGKALPDMRKGVQRKRSLWSLVTVAVAIALVGLFTVGAGVSYADTTSTTAPEHHKTLKYNGDGTYDVTLTVQGKVESSSQTNKKPVDVIIVFDRSNSMAYGMNTSEDAPVWQRRLDYSKKAAGSLISTVFNSSNIDPRVSVVDFGTYARVYTKGYAPSTYASDAAWYSSAETAMNAINKISYPGNNDLRGGTNWQDAFKVANAIPASKSDNSSRGATRYVIFLSDGDPTYRDEYVGNDNDPRRASYTYGVNYSYGQITTGVVTNSYEAASYSYFGSLC